MKSTTAKTSFVHDFLAGIRSIFDIGGVFTSREVEAIEEPCENDYEAIKEDWRTVGREFRKVTNNQMLKKRESTTKKLVTHE